MANKVEIIVVAKDMTGAVFADVERKAKASGEKAGKDAGDGIKQGIENSVKDATVGGSLTETFEKAGKDAGDGFSRGIDGGLEAARGSAVGRAKVIGQDIGKAVGDGLDGALADGGGSNNDGKGLLSRLVGTAQAALSTGQEIGKNVVTGIGSAFSGLDSGVIKTGLIAALVAGAAAAAPLVLAALAGAIAGGAVLSTVIGGAVAAGFTSPEVQAAATGLGETLKQALQADAAPFVQPLLNAIDTVKERFTDLRPTIANLFANSAELVEPLTRAILDSVQYITEGLDSLVANAGPELTQALGNGFRDIGDAVGYMFEELGQTEGVAEGLSAALGLIASTIVFLTDVMAQGAELFDYFGNTLEAINNVASADDLPGKLNAIAEAINAILTGAQVEEGEGIEGQFIHIKDSADAATEAVRGLSEELQYQADQALGMVDPLVAYTKAVEDTAKKQKEFNEAVKEHGPLSEEAQAAGAKLAQSILKEAEAAAKAQGAFAEWTPEMQAAAETADLTTEEIAQLRGSIEQAIQSADEFSKDWVAAIQVKNFEESMAAVDAFKRAIAAIPTSKTTYVNVVTSGAGLAGLRTGGNAPLGPNVGRAATGGIRGNMTLVGEEGPELVRLPFGSSVMPAGQTKRAFQEQTKMDRDVAARDDVPSMRPNDDVVAAIRQLGREIANMRLYINERVIGGVQGYEADLIGRAG